MAENPVICPRCQRAENSYKISVLYLQGLAYLNHHEDAPKNELAQFFSDALPDRTEQAQIRKYISRLIGLISPPQGEKKVLRRMHPDGMMAFLILIALVIIFLASKDQPNFVPALIGLTILCAIMYYLTRQMLIKRYNQSKLREQMEVDRINKAVSNWMKMYLCSHDNIVFESDHGRWTPVENLQNLLFEN